MNVSNRDRWVTCPRPNPEARLRLFCFPYAGAGASVFNLWTKELPAWIEVCAIQLPGRENRLQEPLLQHIEPLVGSLTDALAPRLSRPFAFFGHSMGALVAFEVARELRRRGATAPVHLIVSGRRAPQLVDPQPMNALSEQQLLERLSKMDGTPAAVLQEPELMALFLPILRADLRVNELYVHGAEPPFACPITALAGTHDDRASAAEVEAWREHTRGGFRLETFDGGHFFVKSEREAVLRLIASRLESP